MTIRFPGNCQKVRLILGLLDIEYEHRELSVVDRSDRAEVLGGLSPSLNVLRPHREVLRAKLVLMAAEGKANAEIGERLGMSRDSVGR